MEFGIRRHIYIRYKSPTTNEFQRTTRDIGNISQRFFATPCQSTMIGKMASRTNTQPRHVDKERDASSDMNRMSKGRETAKASSRAMERQQRAILRDAKMAEFERQRRVRESPKASDRIMARWYPDKGPRVAGLRLGGMVYAGCNMSQMPSHMIPEASLIDPRRPVKMPERNEIVSPLQKSPSYASISDTQRGRYLQFLASQRHLRDTDGDVGYAFLYLYGLERRLVIDASIPGVVSDAERRAICREVKRLADEFSSVSQNFRMYATMLLLYDGSIDRETLVGRGTCDFLSQMMRGKVKEMVSRQDRLMAYCHMLIARKVLLGESITVTDMATYAVLNFMQTSRITNAMPVELGRFRVSGLIRLVAKRIARAQAGTKLDVNAGVTTRGRRHTQRRGMPNDYHTSAYDVEYVPANPNLRRIGDLRLGERLGVNPDRMFPMQDLRRIVSESYDDIRTYAALLMPKREPNESRRAWQRAKVRELPPITGSAVSSIPDDVILVLGMPKELVKSLKGIKSFAVIPHDTLAKAYHAAFGRDPQVGKSGKFGQATLDAIRLLLASIGWQAVIPGAYDGDVMGAKWKIGPETNLVAFNRGAQFDRNTGRQSLAAIVSPTEDGLTHTVPTLDDDDDGMTLAVAWLYGWTLRSLGADVTSKTVGLFPASLMPRSCVRQKRPLLALYAYTKAAATYDATDGMARSCIDLLGPERTKAVMFTVMRGLYGGIIPNDTMSVAELAYKRLKIPTSLILHDYHAFDATAASTSAVANGMTLDENELGRMIADTNEIQDMLTDAMEGDETEQGPIERDGQTNVATSESGEAIEGDTQEDITSSAKNGDSNAVIGAILAAFGDEDEMPVKGLQDVLMSGFPNLVTTGDVMRAIAEANEAYEVRTGDTIVDIDGPTALLNA